MAIFEVRFLSNLRPSPPLLPIASTFIASKPKKGSLPKRGAFFLKWQDRQDSNLQPSVLETDALPIELLS